MAVELSNILVAEANKNAYGNLFKENPNSSAEILLNKFLYIKFRLKTALINFYRRNISKVLITKKNQLDDIKLSSNLKNNKELIKDQILNRGFLCINNFINEEFYSLLKNNFPKKNYFIRSKNPIKFFDFGFIYLKEKNHLSENKLSVNLEASNVLKKIYSFFLSQEFENEINDIFKLNNKKLVCKNIISSIAEPGGFLIPHKDNISTKRDDVNVFFVYFIDGLDQDIAYSGGTSIFADKEGSDLLLKPNSLKNNLLIYDPTKNFFHGFKTMKKNSFRKAITFEFYSE